MCRNDEIRAMSRDKLELELMVNEVEVGMLEEKKATIIKHMKEILSKAKDFESLKDDLAFAIECAEWDGQRDDDDEFYDDDADFDNYYEELSKLSDEELEEHYRDTIKNN